MAVERGSEIGRLPLGALDEMDAAASEALEIFEAPCLVENIEQRLPAPALLARPGDDVGGGSFPEIGPCRVVERGKISFELFEGGQLDPDRLKAIFEILEIRIRVRGGPPACPSARRRAAAVRGNGRKNQLPENSNWRAGRSWPCPI
jgi:hypothetical protein